MNTLGALATALQENQEVVDVLNAAITNKADKTYVDELIANIPTESNILIVDCPDGSIISHTFDQIMTAINNDKVVYASVYGVNIMPLTYIAGNYSFVEFNSIRFEDTSILADKLIINSDNTFSIKHENLLNSITITEDEIDNLSSLLV
jgi:hypothetical protein